MKGNEFIKRVKQIGKARNIEVRVDKKVAKEAMLRFTSESISQLYVTQRMN